MVSKQSRTIGEVVKNSGISQVKWIKVNLKHEWLTQLTILEQ